MKATNVRIKVIGNSPVTKTYSEKSPKAGQTYVLHTLYYHDLSSGGFAGQMQMLDVTEAFLEKTPGLKDKFKALENGIETVITLAKSEKAFDPSKPYYLINILDKDATVGEIDIADKPRFTPGGGGGYVKDNKSIEVQCAMKMAIKIAMQTEKTKEGIVKAATEITTDLYNAIQKLKGELK